MLYTFGRGGFYFHYQQRSIDRMPTCLGFSLRTEPDACPLPLATWTEYDRIDTLRYDILGPRRTGRRRNRPGERVAVIEFKAARPADPWRDPFILALLVSVAQGQRTLLRQGSYRVCFDLIARSRASSNSTQTHVILTRYIERDHIHLYTADIPSAFLDRLDHPEQAPSDSPCVSIRHATIPFQPYSTLYTRLLALILPDSHTCINLNQERIGEMVDGGVENNTPEKQQERQEQDQGEVLTKQCEDDG